MSNKEDINKLLKRELKISDNHTENIINASIILSLHGIKNKVRQGWKINTNKKYSREAYLFIELHINKKRYFIDITDNIYINRCIHRGLFTKKPSDKYIAKIYQN